MRPFVTKTCTSASCAAPVVFALSINGSKQILDADPSADGTFFLVGLPDKPLALHLSNLSDKARASAAKLGIPFYTDHHATCPAVDAWR